MQYLLESALLPEGWVRGALVSVTDGGQITAVAPAGGAPPPADCERVAGIVVPGMPNAHSHAFQRGMAGNTEYRLSARDSFWTWRQAMYELANRIEPRDLQVLATQLFIEMLKAGYTSVAEFHYLHRPAGGGPYGEPYGEPFGGPYPGSNPLWDAVAGAAESAGIAMTFLPTLYQTSDFGDRPLRPDQARFGLHMDQFLRAVQTRLDAERRAGPGTLRTGAAFHSLRAVPPAALREAATALRGMDASLPLHIHVAEQIKEVRACIEHCGRRPIELLLDTALLDQHWCLVHATHATPQELAGIAASGAAVCASISTEANLGDGFFDARRFLRLGGRLCIGSDSQATVAPAEELRWMEYQQRLRRRGRGILADRAESHVGTRLWRHAAATGARALGQPAGSIEVGRRADWVVLDREHPSLTGAPLENALDHLLFAGADAAIRDVMVAGRWVVRDGRHAAEQPLRAPFAELMARLKSPGGARSAV
jgi:formimidoylglutamate deiminase